MQLSKKYFSKIKIHGFVYLWDEKRSRVEKYLKSLVNFFKRAFIKYFFPRQKLLDHVNDGLVLCYDSDDVASD